MGDVIRASAAVDDILADARATLENARARGGKIAARAEEGLAPALVMVDAIDDELAAARKTLVPIRAALEAENDNADAILNRTYDDTWNDVGRPANDRYLALMYPGGAAYYTDGNVAEQPARMELLARLYDRKLHPKLSDEQATTYAKRIRDAAKALKVDVDAAAEPTANVALLERVRTALGRAVQFELASLKRSYKNDGMTESQIHEIIPDRPVAKKASKKTEAPPTGGETPGPT